MAFVGILSSRNLAMEWPFSFEKSVNFLRSSDVVMQKLVRAKKATPSSRMERRPPIILNHSSTTFLSECFHRYLDFEEAASAAVGL